MWTAKFKVYDKNGVYSVNAKKHKLNVYGYPLNYYSDKRYFYFMAIGFIEGREKTKKKYVAELKKNPRVHKLEVNGDFFSCITRETRTKELNRFVHLFYNPLIIHISPTIIYPDGWEENEIACFERKHVEEIIKISQKQYDLKLFYFRQQKIKNMGILNVLPELTEKQKEAIQLAATEGYYNYPRKTEVQKLAKLAKLSFSTFQEHLRRAENKLIPFTVKKL